MAACTLDLSRPCFIASLANLAESEEDKQKFLKDFQEKVEKDHRSCHHVIQRFYGNKKFPHLHGKIWKYDWGESSASTRKAWRMVVVVPDPHTVPYALIAAAVYTKSVSEQLSFKELSSIFDSATTMDVAATAEGDSPKRNFHRVPNGDGKTRTICCDCYEYAFVSEHDRELDASEEQHRCDLATDESESAALIPN